VNAFAPHDTDEPDVDLRTLAAVTNLSLEAWRRRIKRAGLEATRTGADGRNYYPWAQLAPLMRVPAAPPAQPTRPFTDNDALYQRLGSAIERERRARGLTRIQFADKIGVARATAAAIERGTHASTVSRLVRIAEALDATPAAVFAAALADPGTLSASRRFILVSRASGIALADGVQWADLAVALRTRGPEPATTIAESLHAALAEDGELVGVRWSD
jgi:transcriptional regulator with XRE-family HTH domain